MKNEIILPSISRVSEQEILDRDDFLDLVEYDNSPTGEVILFLEEILDKDESPITGHEYEARFSKMSELAGYSQALWLEKNWKNVPDFMNSCKGISLDFPGTLATNDLGQNHFVPILVKHPDSCILSWRWVNSRHRSFVCQVACYRPLVS